MAALQIFGQAPEDIWESGMPYGRTLPWIIGVSLAAIGLSLLVWRFTPRQLFEPGEAPAGRLALRVVVAAACFGPLVLLWELVLRATVSLPSEAREDGYYVASWFFGGVAFLAVVDTGTLLLTMAICRLARRLWFGRPRAAGTCATFCAVTAFLSIPFARGSVQWLRGPMVVYAVLAVLCSFLPPSPVAPNAVERISVIPPDPLTGR